MQTFIDEEKSLNLDSKKKKIIKNFQGILANVRSHANRKYFILKNIMLNNLYGVDIMEEATEICKLRLFLKLASQVEPNPKAKNYGIEPLPDIDFNIRCGNSLVGFANYEEVKKAVEGNKQKKLDLFDDMAVINDKARAVSEVYQTFRQIQTQTDGTNFKETKQRLQDSLNSLNEELNDYLAQQYKLNMTTKEYQKWLISHQPFHWFTEFYLIINSGGFDVIIGNPPYVEYSKVKNIYQIKGYETEKCGNLYAFCSERSLLLLNNRSILGFIIPISFVCTQRMQYIQDIIFNQLNCKSWHSIYAERPSKLFEGAEVLLSISIISKKFKSNKCYITGLRKWYSENRKQLFNTTNYNKVQRLNNYIIPKISSNLENHILNHLYNKSKQNIGYFLKSEKSNNLIYYRIGGGRYWKIFTNFQPKFVLNGKLSKSSRENYLYFNNKEERDIVICALSSSLFYWYFILTTNSRDLNPSDIKNFPLDIKKLDKKHQGQLISLSQLLMSDYRKHKLEKEKTSKKTGHIIYEEFYPRLSKPIIDEIDKVLAEHYGFSEEELDFIINYDIKYRMGKELDSD
jgi:methylase of polypeptide subunit release factors